MDFPPQTEQRQYCEWSNKSTQWKIPRPSLEPSHEQKVREEGEDLGLEGAGDMGAGWMLVGL